jgi:hypothetical protein
MGLAGYTARMGHMGKVYDILALRPQGIIILGMGL